MKTTEQASSTSSRASAETLAGHRGHALTAPQQQPIQRSPIYIGDDLLEGSTAEHWDLFWQKLMERYGYKQPVYATALRDIIVEIESWQDEDASPWDGKVLMRALYELQDMSGYEQQPELTGTESGIVKDLLVGPQVKKDTPISDKEIDPSAFSFLLEALTEYARNEYKVLGKLDRPDIDIQSEETNYDTILQRALADILTAYGPKMLQANIVTKKIEPLENLTTAKLYHASTRWDNADKEAKQDAATKAVYWVMASIPSVSSCVQKVQLQSHAKSSVNTVQEAYAKALLASNDKTAVSTLAMLSEIRLKWGPITYGPKIYIQATDKKIKVDDQWPLYQTLIHEALHSAEHPAFHEFLETYIPQGMQSNIREGVVEYLTMKIWGQVLASIQDGGGAPASDNEKLSAAKGKLLNMRQAYQQNASDYGPQLQLITSIVKSLKGGDQRLEAAYIYGNVEAFLPKNLK